MSYIVLCVEDTFHLEIETTDSNYRIKSLQTSNLGQKLFRKYLKLKLDWFY